MRLPASLKALKLVAKGESFKNAKQQVKDRRLAKDLAIPGLDKKLLTKAGKAAAPKDAWDEKVEAQIAFYKKTGMVKLNPQLASKAYIEACRARGLDPVWDRAPTGYREGLTFVPYSPPLHLTKDQIFGKAPLGVGIADDHFFDALRLQRKTVRFADVIAEANKQFAAEHPEAAKKRRVRFADEVTGGLTSCIPKMRGGLAFADDDKVSVKELVAKLEKKRGKQPDR